MRKGDYHYTDRDKLYYAPNQRIYLLTVVWLAFGAFLLSLIVGLSAMFSWANYATDMDDCMVEAEAMWDGIKQKNRRAYESGKIQEEDMFIVLFPSVKLA